MKHFTLLLAAVMTAASASAFSVHEKAVKTNPHKIVKTEKGLDAKKAVKAVNTGRTLDLSRVTTTPKVASRDDSKYPIYEVEGEAKSYSVESLSYAQSWGQLFFEPMSGMKDVVWGEDGEVYLKNFVDIGVDYYVKGTFADGKITIDFPQVVFYVTDDEGDQILSLNVLKFNPDAEYMYDNADAEECSVTIDVAEDGSMSFDLNPDYTYEMFEEDMELPEYIVGLVEITDPGVSDWFGYGDCSQEYTIFDLETVTPPADATFDKWVLSYTNDNGTPTAAYVDIAFAGDDIYLGNINEDVPGWVKGTIADGKAYFESGQYIGYSDLYSTPFYFITGIFGEVYIEEFDWWDFHVEFSDGIYFTYDVENKKLTAEEEGACIVINALPDELYYLDIYIDPEIKWQDPALCNAAPEDPECLYYQAWDPDFYGGQGGIFWNIPFMNKNGAILDTNRMYYHFLVDGEIYPIDPEEYPFVDEYMEDIPYNFSDDMDIWVMGEEHDIYFYFDGAESFGLQSFYVNEEGETFASNIVTYIPETDALTGVTSYVEVLSTKYFDLAGREVTNPQSGLYIKSMRLADGTTRNVKVIMK